MRGLLRKSLASAARRRRGLSLILLGFVLLLMVVFVSFAVDVGRIRLADAQLQTAADSSARCGARALPTSSDYVIDQATDAAEANNVLNTEESNASHLGGRLDSGVVLDADEDIHFGVWNPTERTFTELLDQSNTQQDERRSANAVRTNGRRLDERGNPVKLVFAPVIGVMTSDIQREATAYITGGALSFGFIGIDSVSSNGNGAQIHNDSNETFGGGVASDGNISLGNGDVFGDARPGIGKSLNQGPNSVVTGWTAQLDYKLKEIYTPKTVLGGTSTWSPPNGKSWVIPTTGDPISNDKAHPKEFKINGLTMNGNTNLTVRGYVRLYVTGNVKIDGNQVVNQNGVASQLELVVVGANTSVDVGGNTTQWVHVYAPQSSVSVHGTPGFHGWIVGKTLSFTGTSDLYYDGTNKYPGHFLIRLVE